MNSRSPLWERERGSLGCEGWKSLCVPEWKRKKRKKIFLHRCLACLVTPKTKTMEVMRDWKVCFVKLQPCTLSVDDGRSARDLRKSELRPSLCFILLFSHIDQVLLLGELNLNADWICLAVTERRESSVSDHLWRQSSCTAACRGVVCQHWYWRIRAHLVQ